jgi:hypothetical protein
VGVVGPGREMGRRLAKWVREKRRKKKIRRGGKVGRRV